MDLKSYNLVNKLYIFFNRKQVLNSGHFIHIEHFYYPLRVKVNIWKKYEKR